MIEIKQHKNNEILELKVTEKLTDADLAHLEPVIEKVVNEAVHPRLLMVMEQFSGWEDVSAFWKELKMDTEYLTDFDRIAVIGDASWEEWLTKLTDSLAPNEITFFEHADITHARKWLNAG